MRPPVRIADGLAAVEFDRFDLDAYSMFLACKQLPESQIAYSWESDTYTLTTRARFASRLGVADAVERPDWLPFSEHLFDFQRWVLAMALDAKRFAAWLRMGLGKTHLFCEWARQVTHRTRAKVLIISPLAIIPQTREIAREYFALDLVWLRTTADLIAWCAEPGEGIGITNWEKMNDGVINEFRRLGGIVAEESNRLSTGGGVQKWNLIKSAKGIEYKLSCTATPAPNEVMEYASQASFLEKLRSEGEILWTYFSKDHRTGEWKVKEHAREAFYRSMSSWSIYMQDPSHFGFDDILSTLPAPEIHEYRVPITEMQRELMYGFLTKAGKGLLPDERLGVQERSKLAQLAKGFLYQDEKAEGDKYALIESRKPDVVADLVRADLAEGRQVFVWCAFNAEVELIAERLADVEGCAALGGDTPERERLDILERFRSGELRVLLSKAQLLGFGMNLQFCRSVIYSGFDDSFVRFYQSLGRFVRFGQTETVRVHIPYVPELEQMMLDNIKQKEARFKTEVAEAEEAFHVAHKRFRWVE